MTCPYMSADDNFLEQRCNSWMLRTDNMVANKRLSVGCVSSGRWSSLNCPLAVTLWKRRISLLHLRFQDEEEEPRETFPLLSCGHKQELTLARHYRFYTRGKQDL